MNKKPDEVVITTTTTSTTTIVTIATPNEDGEETVETIIINNENKSCINGFVGGALGKMLKDNPSSIAGHSKDEVVKRFVVTRSDSVYLKNLIKEEGLKTNNNNNNAQHKEAKKRKIRRKRKRSNSDIIKYKSDTAESKPQNSTLRIKHQQSSLNRKQSKKERSKPTFRVSLPQNYRNVSVTGLFGIELEVVMKDYPEWQVPPFIEQVCLHIEETMLDKEGIFRMSGNQIDIKRMRDSLNDGRHVDIESIEDPHALCDLLKLYLRQLPEPLLTKKFYRYFLAAAVLPEEKCIPTFRRLVNKLPKYNKCLLTRLMICAKKVAKHSNNNKMDAANLGKVFGPNILRHPSEASITSPSEIRAAADAVNNVSTLLIANFNEIFKEVKYRPYYKCYVKIIKPHMPSKPDELQLKVDDIVSVINVEKKDEGGKGVWYMGEYRGASGIFPAENCEFMDGRKGDSDRWRNIVEYENFVDTDDGDGGDGDDGEEVEEEILWTMKIEERKKESAKAFMLMSSARRVLSDEEGLSGLKQNSAADSKKRVTNEDDRSVVDSGFVKEKVSLFRGIEEKEKEEQEQEKEKEKERKRTRLRKTSSLPDIKKRWNIAPRGTTIRKDQERRKEKESESEKERKERKKEKESESESESEKAVAEVSKKQTGAREGFKKKVPSLRDLNRGKFFGAGRKEEGQGTDSVMTKSAPIPLIRSLSRTENENENESERENENEKGSFTKSIPRTPRGGLHLSQVREKNG